MVFKFSRENIKTETGRKLYDLLKDILDDHAFLYGILYDLKTEDKMLKMIELLENGLTDTNEITLHATAMQHDVDIDTIKYMLDRL